METGKKKKRKAGRNKGMKNYFEIERDYRKNCIIQKSERRKKRFSKKKVGLGNS